MAHAWTDSHARANSVVIIDDHDIVRFGLETVVQSCPELRLAGSAPDLAEGLRLIAATRPDLVISDMGTGDSRGLDTVRAVVAAQAPRPALIVSPYDELLYGEPALALGAKGYLMKENAHACIMAAASCALAGGVWVSPRLQARLLVRVLKNGSSRTAPADCATLSTREIEVLELLKLGRTTKEIACRMDLSVRTVDVHRARIKRKLGLRTGAELIAFASSRF